MKIAFICPFGLDRLTGTPTRVKTTVKAIGSRHEVFVVAESGSEHNLGFRLITVGEKGIINFTLRALKAMKKENPDAVHVFTTAGVVSALAFKMFFRWRAKIIFEMHGWAWFELGGQNIFRRLVFLILDYTGLWFADKVIAMSHSQFDFLSKLTFNRQKISVVWGTIDKDLPYTPLPERSEIIVGYIGNSSWWQGVGYLVKAAELISQTKENIRFKFAGFDNVDFGKFPKLPNVAYLGKISNDDLAHLLLDCDIFVSSRLKEKVTDLQFPHKLYEYMSAGRPIIASSANDQPMIINASQCGTIVDPINADSLAKAILDVASLPKAKREEMGRNAVAYSRSNFSFDMYQAKLYKIYSSL